MCVKTSLIYIFFVYSTCVCMSVCMHIFICVYIFFPTQSMFFYFQIFFQDWTWFDLSQDMK